MNIEKAKKVMEDLELDGILLTDLYNIRYFTGFTGTTGIGLISKKGNFFFSDFRYKEQGKLEVEKEDFEFVEVSRGALNKIGEYVEKLGIRKLGIEDKQVTVSYYKELKNTFQAELIGVENKLQLIRMIKTNKEIEIIKRAIEISDYSFQETIKVIKKGMTEKEIAAHIEYMQRKMGADDTSFATIVASGVRSAMPHGVASDKKIEEDEFITIDFGCYYDGYVSDMTRTIYFGNNISDKHKEIYNTVLNAQLMGVNNIKSGMLTSEIDKIVRDYITEKGYGDKFGHGLGHGIGLEIHEAPALSPVTNTVLEENMVVTVEPGIYVEGFGGVRIEDDVVITKSGCEILNKTSKELKIIRY